MNAEELKEYWDAKLEEISARALSAGAKRKITVIARASQRFLVHNHPWGQ